MPSHFEGGAFGDFAVGGLDPGFGPLMRRQSSVVVPVGSGSGSAAVAVATAGAHARARHGRGGIGLGGEGAVMPGSEFFGNVRDGFAGGGHAGGGNVRAEAAEGVALFRFGE